VITLIIWLFYEETAISAKWSIKQKDFLFYFLFSVAIIPFQITIDIFFYNIMYYYLDKDYITSLKKWNYEYTQRGDIHFWRGYAHYKLDLESKLRPLEQLSFSSQFYFLSYLGVAGHLFVIIGMMVILETKESPFADALVLPLLLINQVFIYAVEKLCIFMRRKFKVWERSENGAMKESEVKTTKAESEIWRKRGKMILNINPFGSKADGRRILSPTAVTGSTSKSRFRRCWCFCTKKYSEVGIYESTTKDTEEDDLLQGKAGQNNIYEKYKE